MADRGWGADGPGVNGAGGRECVGLDQEVLGQRVTVAEPALQRAGGVERVAAARVVRH